MTSTEFAAKYRLLKNVASRGARSFLAQQVQLGRMVMVHYLDAHPREQRGDALARLQNLQPEGRAKLLEIVEVDGVSVAVTLFISSFVDFDAWLDRVADDSTIVTGSLPAPATPVPTTVPSSGDFTGQFGKLETSTLEVPAPRLDSSVPAPAPDAAAAGSGSEFTRVFGKVDLARAADAATTLPPNAETQKASSPPDFSVDSPTLIIEPPQQAQPPRANFSAPPSLEIAPRAATVDDNGPVPPPADLAPPPSAPFHRQAPAEPSFTAIFGHVAGNPSPAPAPAFPSSLPQIPVPAARVMPPVYPEAERPVPPKASAPPPAPPAGEFTQLFQRLNPGGTAPSGGFAPPSEVPRPFEPTPRADMSAASTSSRPPEPQFGSGSPPQLVPPISLGAGAMAPPPMAVPPAPAFGAPPSHGPSGLNEPSAPGLAPPSSASALPQLGRSAAPPWGVPTVPAASGPSEFTRILGRVQTLGQVMASAPQTSTASSAAPLDATASQATEARRDPKSYMPLIVAANILVAATIGIVVYFVLKS